MTIKIGPIEGFAVHFATEDRAPEQGPPPLLCLNGGDALAFRTINTWTTDRAKVTCQPCIEWMHA